MTFDVQFVTSVSVYNVVVSLTVLAPVDRFSVTGGVDLRVTQVRVKLVNHHRTHSNKVQHCDVVNMKDAKYLDWRQALQSNTI